MSALGAMLAWSGAESPVVVQQIYVGALIVIVFAAFLKEARSPDLIAMTALAALIVTGILTTDRALMVFSNPAPVTVACMFILSAALERTGAIEALAQRFRRIAGKSELRVMFVLMMFGAILSAFVNNTPVVVVFLPIVMSIARELDLSVSRLLIPLSYASIVGGTCTIIGTSTNLVVDGIVRQHGIGGFGMFEVGELGIVFVLVTLLYMVTIGRKLLPHRTALSALLDAREGREFLTQAVVGKESPLVGKPYLDTALAKLREIRVIEVVRDGQRLSAPLNELEFKEGDHLLLKGRLTGVMGIQQTEGLDLGSERKLGLERINEQSAVLMEGIVGPQSSMVGRSLRQLNFRQRYGVLILALHRRGVNLQERFENVQLHFGDTILVEGPVAGMKELFKQKDFINLTQPTERPFRRAKAPIAIAAIVAFILLGAFKVLPPAGLAIVLVTAILLSRCIDPQEAYESVQWRVIFLIFGMLGLGQALEATHLDTVIAHSVLSVFGGLGPAAMVSVLYLLAAILTELISNNAVAALLAPIALGVGAELGVDPRPFLIAVMFGSSASLSTPIGYQTNTYIYGAGGYKFTDFTRVGLPLAFILWIVASILIPILWPVRPL